MLHNVTLSAEKQLIDKARKRAETKNTTLNAEFRRWLEQYVEGAQTSADFDVLMDRFSYVKAGKSFTRDDFNER
jgi:hypothetical protein